MNKLLSFKKYINEKTDNPMNYYNVFKNQRRINALVKNLKKRGIDASLALQDPEMKSDPVVRDLQRSLNSKMRRGSILSRVGISGFDQQDIALKAALPAIVRKIQKREDKKFKKFLNKAVKKYKTGSQLNDINSYLARTIHLHTIGKN